MILGAAIKYKPPPEVEELIRGRTAGYNDSVSQVIIVLGAALIIGALIFLLVYLTRRNKYSAADDGTVQEKNPYQLEDARSSGFHLFGKRRRKYRKHRPRNPTLSETGGLPPVRQDESVNPPS